MPTARRRELLDRRQAADAGQPPARADRRSRDASQALVHVRDYTKGHPSIPANNHPVRHGPVVGIHNGIIVNDDEILVCFDCARAEPRMTVDTEAILALAAHSRVTPRAFEQLRGRWPLPGSTSARPTFSTSPAVPTGRSGRTQPPRARLRVHEARARGLERYAGLKLRKHEVREGTFLAVRDGEIVRQERFRPDHEFVEAETLPAVRAPGETEACLSTLALLAAA